MSFCVYLYQILRPCEIWQSGQSSMQESLQQLNANVVSLLKMVCEDASRRGGGGGGWEVGPLTPQMRKPRSISSLTPLPAASPRLFHMSSANDRSAADRGSAMVLQEEEVSDEEEDQ